MRVLKHSFLSLIRKPVKGIMIFCVLILVFGLVFTGIIIKNSVAESKEYIRVELGATVTITPDYLQFRLDDKEDYSELQPTESMATVLSDDERVKDVYLVKNAWTQVNNMKSGREFGREKEEIITEDSDTFFQSSASLDMLGSSQAIPLEFAIGNLEIKEGKYFTEDQMTNGEFVALITTQFASVNNLSVGDTFKVLNERKMQRNENYDYEDEANMDEFTIVGLFEAKGTNTTDRIYVPLEISREYAWSDEEVDTIDAVYLLLTDPLDVDAFIEDHEGDIPNKYMKLTANEEVYEQLTQPLDLLEMITSILIGVIFVAGALIVLSIVTIFVRDRKFEVGLLLASGESRLRIIAQFVLEIFIVAIIAFIVSAGATQLASKPVGNWIVEHQLKSEEASEEDQYMALYGDYDQTKGDISMDKVAEDFDVSLKLNVVLNLLLVSMLILFVAASIPLVVILSYKPREALQD